MSNKLEVTLKKSVIGGTQGQRKTVEALGLKKIRQSVVLDDTPAVRGMIDKVSHLLDVKEA
jgi:large subunit ribosomal protein L30